MKLKCIAVDDEHNALEIIKKYATDVPFIELKGTFRSGLKALEYLQNNKVDLIFLDINMPGFTGIQLTKTFSPMPLTIFTTAYSEYAVESYELNAVDYLVKPFEFDRFLKAALKALSAFEAATPNQVSVINEAQEKPHIFIKSGTKILRINLKDILYIEGAGSYVTYVTTDNKYTCLNKIQDVIESLPESQFARIHKSHIIAIGHINKVERNRVYIGNKVLAISRTYQSGFLKKLKLS